MTSARHGPIIARYTGSRVCWDNGARGRSGSWLSGSSTGR